MYAFKGLYLRILKPVSELKIYYMWFLHYYLYRIYNKKTTYGISIHDRSMPIWRQLNMHLSKMIIIKTVMYIVLNTFGFNTLKDVSNSVKFLESGLQK